MNPSGRLEYCIIRAQVLSDVWLDASRLVAPHLVSWGKAFWHEEKSISSAAQHRESRQFANEEATKRQEIVRNSEPLEISVILRRTQWEDFGRRAVIWGRQTDRQKTPEPAAGAAPPPSERLTNARWVKYIICQAVARLVAPRGA